MQTTYRPSPVANTDGIGGLGPWYADLFGSVYLVEETTSLSGKVRYYDTAGDLEYQEYNLYLYQRLGNRSLVRLGYRFYRDNQDLDSHAVGIKLKRYFTPRFSAHIGYRYYDHSIGPNFDTALAGFGLLL